MWLKDDEGGPVARKTKIFLGFLSFLLRLSGLIELVIGRFNGR